MAELVRCEGEEIGVAETLAGRHRFVGGRGGRLEVTTRLLLEDEWQQQVAMLDAVRFLLVEDAPRTAEPAACASQLTRAARWTPIQNAQRRAGSGWPRSRWAR